MCACGGPGLCCEALGSAGPRAARPRRRAERGGLGDAVGGREGKGIRGRAVGGDALPLLALSLSFSLSLSPSPSPSR